MFSSCRKKYLSAQCISKNVRIAINTELIFLMVQNMKSFMNQEFNEIDQSKKSPKIKLFSKLA